jgi:RNA polymerase sigma factor (sigma-70 family)
VEIVWQVGRAGRSPAATGEPASPALRPSGAGPQVRPDLERVFRAEYPRVVGIARRVLGQGEEAEDAAQEVFLAFARSGVPRSQAPGWLAVAAAHTALNAVRSRQRRSRRESAFAAPDHVPDVADHVLAEEGRAQVRQALARLPRRQALVVLLRHSGLSYQEIAARLDMPVGSVGTTLRRAEAAVRKELGGHGSLD